MNSRRFPQFPDTVRGLSMCTLSMCMSLSMCTFSRKFVNTSRCAPFFRPFFFSNKPLDVHFFQVDVLKKSFSMFTFLYFLRTKSFQVYIFNIFWPKRSTKCEVLVIKQRKCIVAFLKKYHKEKDTIFPEKYGQKIGIMTIKRL